MMQEINTTNLILRRFKETDGDDLYEFLGDPQIVQFEPYPPYTRQQAHESAKNRSQCDFFWAICLKETGKLIGNIYFNRQEPVEFGNVDLGYIIGRNYQRKGYALESCKAMIDYGFNEMGVRRIVAKCNVLNTASYRLLERLNMRREGHFIKSLYFKRDEKGEPIWIDSYWYSMLKEEWQSSVAHRG
jgi:RimJ/RimL family protein N-acetyltransferase